MKGLRTEAQRELRRLIVLCAGVTAVLAASLLASLFGYAALSRLLLYFGPLPVIAFLLLDDFLERRRREVQRRMIEDLEKAIERASR